MLWENIFERFHIFEKLKIYGYLIKTKNGIIVINDLDKKETSLSIGEILEI